MANISGNSYATLVRSQDRDVIQDSATAVFDANGNATLINSSPGMALRHTGVGLYSLSFKAAPEARLFVYIAASTTLHVVKGLLFNPTLDVDGASIAFFDVAGMLADPQAGNLVHFFMHHLPSVAR